MKTGPVILSNTSFQTIKEPTATAAPSLLQRIWNVLASIWNWIKNLFFGSTPQPVRVPVKAPEPINLEEWASGVIKAVYTSESLNSSLMSKSSKALFAIEKDGKTHVVHQGIVQKEAITAYANEVSKKLVDCLKKIGPDFNYASIWVGKGADNKLDVGTNYGVRNFTHHVRHDGYSFTGAVNPNDLSRFLNLPLQEKEKTALIKFLSE